MTKYVPKHLVSRAGHLEAARLGAAAARGSRSAVALGVGAALPAGAAIMSAPAFAAEDAPAPAAQQQPSRILSFDSRGSDVESVQARLALVRDGWYGPVTTAAVKDFQRANGLGVDGVVGPLTRAALEKSSAASSAGADSTIASGDEGPLVRAVQAKLGLSADGVFGPKTEAAVKAFQRSQKLAVDGVVGVRTTYALAHADAADIKAAASAGDDATKPSGAGDSHPAKPAKPSIVHPHAPYELPFLAGYPAPITQGPFSAASHHKWYDKHAVDFGVPTGTPIVASASGTVYKAENNVTGGKSILIRDASGYCMEYAHLSTMNVYPGQVIAQGQNIGRSGATGNVTGPHLHWGIVDCASYTSIHIPDSKETGRSYIAGTVAVSRNGA